MLEDIRLTSVDVMARYKKWCEDDELHGSDTFAEYIANAATDKANLWWLNKLGISSREYDVHSCCELCGGQVCINTDEAGELSTLWKTVKEK